MKRFFVLLALLFLSVGAFAYPLSASDAEVVNALNYLKTQQGSDGCIGGFATSAWVISSVVAAGQDPASAAWSNGGNSLVDCITSDLSWFNDSSRKATDFERQIIAIVAAGEDPTNFNNLDYVAKLESMYDGTQMGDASLLIDDFWGIIALIAAGEAQDSAEINGMVDFLMNNKGADNGWSWGAGQASDVDSTATAVMALVAAGRNQSSNHITTILNALDFIKSQQDSSTAGFMSWGQANPDSSSYGVDAIAAFEQDPTANEWQENGTNPAEYLLTWQQADGGFSNPYANPPGKSSEWTTANALNALLGKPYPVKVLQKLRMPIRIEAPDQTLLNAEIELPISIDFTASNSGTQYTLTDPSLLMGLLQAATENGFSVSVSDEWYPAMGFYVHNIVGQEAAGLDGWNFRVDNRTTGFNSVDGFIWQESNPPNPPHSEVAWFYGSWDSNALRVTTATIDVKVGEDIDVLVEYIHEDDGVWYPLEGATVKGADSEQTTNAQGTATIRFSSGGIKEVYAEKPDAKYFRSDKLQFSAEGGQQTSSSVEMTGNTVPAIAFSVSPASIDFGAFGPGYNVSGPDLTLKNKGSWNLEIEAELTDNEGTIYTSSLLLDGSPWGSFLAEIVADTTDFVNSLTVATGLSVPANYSETGTETGTLIFWARATGIP